MHPSPVKSRGYSLIELLLVLIIVAILAVAGVVMIRPRRSDSVRSIMAELEGVIVNTQNSASISTRDIYLTTQGDWIAGTLYMDGRPLLPTVASPPGTGDLTNAANRVGSPAEVFHSLYTAKNSDHLNAGVDTTGTWYTVALGSAPDLATLPPFSASTSLLTALHNPLFIANNAVNDVVFNGISRQFNTGFAIVVVGLAGGSAVPNGPIGVLVVPAQSGEVFKYFKPNGSTQWGRM